MTDIVSRLRAKRVRGRPGFYNPDELCQEAANEIERLRKAPGEQEDAVYAAYLGISVLQTMCRKAGLPLGVQRSTELLTELSIAFPTTYERVLLLALRNNNDFLDLPKMERDRRKAADLQNSHQLRRRCND